MPIRIRHERRKLNILFTIILPKKNPKSQFLFCYSGHGILKDGKGYLLKTYATTKGNDKNNYINLEILRTLINEVVSAGHHILVLLNACNSGAFLDSKFCPPEYILENPGAHAITAGGTDQPAWHKSSVGPGSVFFEKVIEGIQGGADYKEDNFITSLELALFLKDEIENFSDINQDPRFGPLSDGNGQFYFKKTGTKSNEPSTNKSTSDDLKQSMGISGKREFAEAKKLLTKENYNTAMNLFYQAYNFGVTESARYLGWMYYKGLGEQDHNKAINWFKQSAESGDKKGMIALGIIQREGLFKDYPKAYSLFERAAEEKLPEGMYNLGIMHEYGFGVPRNLNKARYWYERASKLHYKNADTKLAQIPRKLRFLLSLNLNYFSLTQSTWNGISKSLPFIVDSYPGITGPGLSIELWLHNMMEFSTNLGFYSKTGNTTQEDIDYVLTITGESMHGKFLLFPIQIFKPEFNRLYLGLGIGQTEYNLKLNAKHTTDNIKISKTALEGKIHIPIKNIVFSTDFEFYKGGNSISLGFGLGL